MKCLVLRLLQENIRLRRKNIQLRRHAGWQNKEKLALLQRIKVLENAKETNVNVRVAANNSRGASTK